MLLLGLCQAYLIVTGLDDAAQIVAEILIYEHEALGGQAPPRHEMQGQSLGLDNH